MQPIRFLPLLALVVAACTSSGSDTADTAGTPGMRGDTARDAADQTTGVSVSMRDASGRELGTLMISESEEGLVLSGDLRGLPPGQRAIHLHTVGQCAAPFQTAGGHWNPTERQHGFDNPQGPHAGDMRNLEVGTDSTVSVRVTSTGGTLRGTQPLLDADGAAVVIHAGPDDYRTDPSGNSGDRIACGVVNQ